MRITCPKCGGDKHKIVNTNKAGAPRFKYACLKEDCRKLWE